MCCCRLRERRRRPLLLLRCRRMRCCKCGAGQQLLLPIMHRITDILEQPLLGHLLPVHAPSCAAAKQMRLAAHPVLLRLLLLLLPLVVVLLLP